MTDSESNLLSSDDAPKRPNCLVVVGASAGGLEALSTFFASVSSRSPAFVVIQHLSPDHRSMMAQLLARHTDLPVSVIQDGDTLQAGRVHLIPPGSFLRLEGDTLYLEPRPTARVMLPVDAFLFSAATHWGARTIAVILTGTGTDGTAGVLAVNKAGGKVLVQDPTEAEFDGMPASAVATGVADQVKDLAGLAAVVAELVPQVSRSDRPVAAEQPTDSDPAAPVLQGEAPEALAESILQVLQAQSDADFTGYKTDLLLRRVAERCRLLQVRDISEYLAILRAQPSERSYLTRELLIPLTRFFREPDVFASLAREVLDPLVADWPDERPIRVWCAGVASGEEAYTLSILFQEAFARHQKWPPLKIFATDVDASLLEQASAGHFSAAIRDELDDFRLERWFKPAGEGYRVRKVVREPVVFARHNLTRDPPFARLQLVVCRNVLIYLRPESKESALLRLLYALVPGGVLLLGQSEAPETDSDKLVPLGGVQGMYRLLRPVRMPPGGQPRTRRGTLVEPAAPRLGPAGPASEGAELAVQTLQQQVQRAYTPPTLIVDTSLSLIHVLGDTQPLLGLDQGHVAFTLERLLDTGLRQTVLPFCEQVLQAVNNQTDLPEPIQVRNAQNRTYQLEVRVTGSSAAERYLALSFVPLDDTAERTTTATEADRVSRSPAVVREGSTDHGEITRLELALAESRRREKASVVALESTNEELQATNEELLTSNEELHSTNEELQSLNEELYTVNSELQAKIRELNTLHHDMDNMAQTLGMASLIVDHQLRIQRFTEGMTRFLPLRQDDEGRHLGEISLRALYPELLQDIERCIDEKTYVEATIPSGGRSWLPGGEALADSGSDQNGHRVRIMPYRERNKRVTGVVVTVINL